MPLGPQDLEGAFGLGQALADAIQSRSIDDVPDNRRAITGDGSDDGVAIALDGLAHVDTLKKKAAYAFLRGGYHSISCGINGFDR